MVNKLSNNNYIIHATADMFTYTAGVQSIKMRYLTDLQPMGCYDSDQ